MNSNQTCNSYFWTRKEDKAFENAPEIYSDASNACQKNVAVLPGRTITEIKENTIESGLVPLPNYADSFKKSEKKTTLAAVDIKGKRTMEYDREQFGITIDIKGKRLEKDSREQSKKIQIGHNSWEISPQPYRDPKRSKPWSKKEHGLFLQGLDKYGRGDWRSLSRHCIQSRTPSQVASHVQKFFKPMDISGENKTRLSIHDVTILDDGKIVTQQLITTKQNVGVADNSLTGTMLSPSSSVVGTDMQCSVIDSQSNLSTPQGRNSEAMIIDVDSDIYDSLMDNLLAISTSSGPSNQEISEAADLNLCTPLIASQHNISTLQMPISKQIIPSDVIEFCDSLFADEHEMYDPRVSMTGQVTRTAEGEGGARIANFVESSSSGHPDIGIHALPTASQLIPESISSDVVLPGFIPSSEPSRDGSCSPDSASFLYDSLDDITAITYPLPSLFQK